jgi:hypothetical protein
MDAAVDERAWRKIPVPEERVYTSLVGHKALTPCGDSDGSLVEVEIIAYLGRAFESAGDPGIPLFMVKFKGGRITERLDFELTKVESSGPAVQGTAYEQFYAEEIALMHGLKPTDSLSSGHGSHLGFR